MTPILRKIQTEVVSFLQKQTEFNGFLKISAHNSFTLAERTQKRLTQAAPYVLLVDLPWPLQTLPNLTTPCWGSLALNCILLQSVTTSDKAHFIDCAEQISFSLASASLTVNKLWRGQFKLSEKTPWEWLTLSKKQALKIQFISNNFDLNPS